MVGFGADVAMFGTPTRFVHRLRPRYSEVDMQGVVFYGHWLNLFDDAFSRFLDWLGLPPKPTFATTFDVMVVKAVVEWAGPANFDDLVEIQVLPVRLGRSSFDMRYEATVLRRPACSATITYVSVVPVRGGTCPIPPDVRARIEALDPSLGDPG